MDYLYGQEWIIGEINFDNEVTVTGEVLLNGEGNKIITNQLILPLYHFHVYIIGPRQSIVISDNAEMKDCLVKVWYR